MTLTANFRLGTLGKKRRVLSDFGQLITIRGFLHDRVASDATHPSARVRACIPIGLHSALVACQAGLILESDRFAAVLPKANQSANAPSTAGGNMVAAGPVAVLAGLFLAFVSGVEKKNFAHQRLGKFFKLRGVASLTNFGADVRGRRFSGRFIGGFLKRFFFRRPSRMRNATHPDANK